MLLFSLYSLSDISHTIWTSSLLPSPQSLCPPLLSFPLLMTRYYFPFCSTPLLLPFLPSLFSPLPSFDPFTLYLLALSPTISVSPIALSPLSSLSIPDFSPLSVFFTFSLSSPISSSYLQPSPSPSPPLPLPHPC